MEARARPPGAILGPTEAIERFLADIEEPARILIAVSGGSDSLGLLLALSHLTGQRAQGRITLVAATIDHALRDGSVEEARFVSAICASLAIPHVVRRWDGEKPSSGLSAAARLARYELLCQIAVDQDATIIVTGHTLDDLIETVQMRSRRSGGDAGIGAAGMAPFVLLNRRVWLGRPFLSTRRAAIRAFVAGQGQRWIDDPSNTDPRFERARVRAALTMDEMEAARRQADIAAAGRARQDLSFAAAELVERFVSVESGVVARCDTAMFREDEKSWRYLLGILAAIIGGQEHAPGQDVLAQLAGFITGAAPGRLTAGRVVFDRRSSGVWLTRERRNLPVVEILPGMQEVWDGRFLICNRSPQTVEVGPRPPDGVQALARFPGCPSRVAHLAWGGLPQMALHDLHDSIDCTATPILRPFENFLPYFELKLAVSLSVKVGSCRFSPLPLKVFVRKT